MLLVDREQGNVISLTLWRDAETAAASAAAVQKHLDHYEEMTAIRRRSRPSRSRSTGSPRCV